MSEVDKQICDRTKKALSSYVDYVQEKIDRSAKTAAAGRTVNEMELVESVRALNHVSGILLKLKEFESEESSRLTVHNNYSVNH